MPTYQCGRMPQPRNNKCLKSWGYRRLASCCLEHGSEWRFVVEMLVAKELISREELLLLLGDAEDAVCRERRTSLAGLRMLIERGFG